jgi:hypothetical protein
MFAESSTQIESTEHCQKPWFVIMLLHRAVPTWRNDHYYWVGFDYNFNQCALIVPVRWPSSARVVFFARRSSHQQPRPEQGKT